MRFLRKLFYGTMVAIMMICAGILILAFSPDLTKQLSETLYGENGIFTFAKQWIPTETEKDDTNGGQAMEAPESDAYRVAEGVLAGDSSAGYVAPIRGALNLPGAVSNKTGLQPVTSSLEALEEDAAAELGTSLKTLETGDGLNFDVLMYPYYHMLNPTMQHMYRQIYANALAGNTSFAPVEKINTAQLKNVFEAVYNDHPELFWLETGYRCKYRAGGECVEITLSYNRTAQNLEYSKSEFDSAAQKILEGARQETDVMAKATYVHDQLLKKANYSVTAGMNQSAYSALVDGDTVCSGYARAYQYLLQKLEIPCYYCTGYSGEDHAWNLVKFEDGFGNVDVTWDDTDPATYDFFDKSDAEFVGTHVRTSLSVYLPPCLGKGESGEPVADGADGNYLDGGNVVAGITLNPNPTTPLIWEPKPEKEVILDGSFVSDGDLYNKNVAGLSDEMIQKTLADYYRNCQNQMVERGVGQQSFSNVVPKYVLKQVERAYGTGEYQDKYVKEGLKRLEAENFAIQIRVVDLGGNYYRLYHNIYVW